MMYGSGQKNRRVMSKICLTCGYPFRPTGTREYCSYDCKGKFDTTSKHLDAFGPPKEKPKKIYICEKCGDLTVNRLRCNFCRGNTEDLGGMYG